MSLFCFDGFSTHTLSDGEHRVPVVKMNESVNGSISNRVTHVNCGQEWFSIVPTDEEPWFKIMDVARGVLFGEMQGSGNPQSLGAITMVDGELPRTAPVQQVRLEDGLEKDVRIHTMSEISDSPKKVNSDSFLMEVAKSIVKMLQQSPTPPTNTLPSRPNAEAINLATWEPKGPAN